MRNYFSIEQVAVAAEVSGDEVREAIKNRYLLAEVVGKELMIVRNAQSARYIHHKGDTTHLHQNKGNKGQRLMKFQPNTTIFKMTRGLTKPIYYYRHEEGIHKSENLDKLIRHAYENGHIGDVGNKKMFAEVKCTLGRYDLQRALEQIPDTVDNIRVRNKLQSALDYANEKHEKYLLARQLHLEFTQ